MTFRTVFDLTVSGYHDWEFPAVVGAITLCFAVFCFVRLRTFLSRNKFLGNITVSAVALFLIGRNLIDTYSDYKEIMSEISNGKAKEHTGIIEDVVQTKIMHGTQESISVNGHSFSFSSNSPYSDFHEIGLFHKGEAVRLTAVGQRLVKVEVEGAN